MTAAIGTLFEGDFHLGAAALINSLHAAGFDGQVICGYRGVPPPWAEAAAALARPAVTLRPAQTQTHLTNYKPEFLETCWNEDARGADTLYYFDPDVVVKAPWPTLTRWAADGVALCEDVNNYLPVRHPYRLAWADFFERHGVAPVRALERYYNAGFIGIRDAHRALLASWRQVLELAERELGPLDRIKVGAPYALWHTPDQDALNMALLLHDFPINGAGPEAMDFRPGGHLLSHAIGGGKPWRGGFLRDALRGHPPSMAQKSFFQFLDGPLPVLPPVLARQRRRELAVAAAIGRFYRRT